MPEARTTGGGLPGRRFKPYPAYKDSGAEWLGEIPAHWTALPSRRLIGRVEQGWSPLAEDRLADLDEWGVIKLSAVNKGTFLPDEHKALPADLAPDTRYEIRAGDFLLTRANTPDLVGDACVVGEVRRGLMLCDLVYRVQLRSDRVTPTFLGYWLLSRIGRYQIEVDARGSSQSMVKVSQRHIRAWTVVLPPVEEQVTIATFLARETATIDALVAKKERLIELLQEKRAALITRAVTKGLDPNVPMKDSGVEWLREIPAHWEVKPLKHLVPGVTVGIVVTPAKYYVDEGVPCLRSLNISGGKIDMRNLVFINADANELHRKSKIYAGDVVVVRTGRAGTAAIIPADLNEANCIDLLIIRHSQQLQSKFVYYYLNSNAAISQAGLTSVGAIQAHYNTSTLATLFVPVIPLPEQETIETYLDEQVQKLDAMVAKVGAAIDRLKELRLALISAAVTGKIDVRDAGEG